MSSTNNPSWAWLGLLKWSLSYHDGTNPNSTPPEMMSAEKKAFLEEVMKHGIINEGERMKEILEELTKQLEDVQARTHTNIDNNIRMIELLEELRDIVEQIDYARAFVSLQGLPFLLGCASENLIPVNVRAACVGVVSTLAQNNPPVQQALLDLSAVHTLSEIYFADEPKCDPNDNDNDDDNNNNDDDKIDVNGGDEEAWWNLKGKNVQAINAIVRGHKAAEEAFVNDHVCRLIISRGLGVADGGYNPSRDGIPPVSLVRRCIFFLRAIVCSDFSSRRTVRVFHNCIDRVIFFVVNKAEYEDEDIRQSALDLLLEIMTQRKSVDLIMNRKQNLLPVLIARVAELRKLDDNSEEREWYALELECCEGLIQEIAKGRLDEEENIGEQNVLLLEGRQSEDDFRNAPQ